jgi:hypothetical protein
MSRVAYQCLACFFLSCVIGGLVPARHGLFAAEDARLPLPPQEKVEEALALIRDAYEADYRAAKESGEPEQLIAQLNGLASGEADPVRKYALFVEAENVASAHDNFKKAVELLDARAELFRIDGLALRSDLLKRLAGPKVSADLELCDQAMDTAQKAMRSERFDLASEAAALAVSIAKAIDREQKAAMRKQRKKDGGNFVAPPSIGVELVKKSTALQAQVTATEKLFEQYGDAVQKAKSSPDSPSANAVIGSYLCFVRQDWKAGLPALAKSDFKEFSALAANDLELTAAPSPMDAQKAFELAGKWWTAAESNGVSADHESAIKDHAATLYADIADRLSDTLQKRVAASRLRGIVKPGHAEAALSDSQAGRRDGGSATVAPQRAERSKWVEDNGNRTFRRDADSMLWREYGRDGRSSFVFKQTAETPEYVEIVDEGRNMICRIRKDVFEWTTRDKPDSWNFMAHGSWEFGGRPAQDVPHGAIANRNAEVITSKNLLLHCDVIKDAISGKWTKVDDGIQSDGTAPAKMRLPFVGKLPEQYDFQIEFTPLGGQLCVTQLLSAYGTGFGCDFGGWGNKVVAFQLVDGRHGKDNVTATLSPAWLKAGSRHTARIQVRKESVTALLDGKHVVKLPTDFKNLKHRPDWAIPLESIGVGSWGTPTVFHRASLIAR